VTTIRFARVCCKVQIRERASESRPCGWLIHGDDAPGDHSIGAVTGVQRGNVLAAAGVARRGPAQSEQCLREDDERPVRSRRILFRSATSRGARRDHWSVPMIQYGPPHSAGIGAMSCG
jgi:hypothetical protein